MRSSGSGSSSRRAPGGPGSSGGRSTGTPTLRRCYRHLVIAYDPREWWQHDIWSPKFDARIPIRDARARPGARRLRLPRDRAAVAARGGEVAAEDRARDRPVALADDPPAARVADDLRPVHRRARDRPSRGCARTRRICGCWRSTSSPRSSSGARPPARIAGELITRRDRAQHPHRRRAVLRAGWPTTSSKRPARSRDERWEQLG